MKYIIDIPKEHEFDWVNKSSRFGFELCFPINETATNKKYHIPTGLKLESYTEPDREAIENEVWEFARAMNDLSYDDFVSCFDGETEEFVYGLPYSTIKGKYNAWKKRKEEIHVGDEVCIAGTTSVVVRIPKGDEKRVHYISSSGTVYCNNGYADIVKTGRHFDEVESLLKKMRGEQE